MNIKLLTGNEAVALGLDVADVKVASAYPGTPSTEILETVGMMYKDVYAEWAPNEKVALETAIGASLSGVRAFASMKHVGLNVAADPLFTFSYTGVRGGLVIVSADDPGMHSSQNEQDNRNFAKASKVMMLEPSNSAECFEMTVRAFELSEKFDTPVLIRMTTRVCHSKSLVDVDKIKKQKIKPVPYVKDIQKFVATPANAIKRRKIITEREQTQRAFSKGSDLNKVIDNKSSVGVISSGVSFEYANEVFGEKVNYLKIGISYPLCKNLFLDFAKGLEKIFVIEETDPYLEFFCNSIGIQVYGKEVLPDFGELNSDILRDSFKGLIDIDSKKSTEKNSVPLRPPAMCAGCPHRGLFYPLSKIKDIIVTGDIGCYTLASAMPLLAVDSCFCMGASISTAHGASIALTKGATGYKRVVGVLGDSTFLHTGINSLVNVIYNKSNAVSIILDNRITAMTGHQQNPGTGFTLRGEVAGEIDIEKLVLSLGFTEKQVKVIDPLNLDETEKVLDEVIEDDTMPYVIITKSPCILKKMSEDEKKKYGLTFSPLRVKEMTCVGCKKCMQTGCPAISLISAQDKTKNGKVKIDENMCTGCSLCKQVCPMSAITGEKSD